MDAKERCGIEKKLKEAIDLNMFRFYRSTSPVLPGYELTIQGGHGNCWCVPAEEIDLMPSSYAWCDIPVHWMEDELIEDILTAVDRGTLHFPEERGSNEKDAVADFISYLESELARAREMGGTVETSDRVYLCSDLVSATVTADMLAFTGRRIESGFSMGNDGRSEAVRKSPDCFDWWCRKGNMVIVSGCTRYGFDARQVKRDSCGRYLEKSDAMKPLCKEGDIICYMGGHFRYALVKRGSQAYSDHEILLTNL